MKIKINLFYKHPSPPADQAQSPARLRTVATEALRLHEHTQSPHTAGGQSQSRGGTAAPAACDSLYPHSENLESTTSSPVFPSLY